MLTENSFSLASTSIVMIKDFPESIGEIHLKERAEWGKGLKINLWCLAPPFRYFTFSRQVNKILKKKKRFGEMKAVQIFLGMMAKVRNLNITLEV